MQAATIPIVDLNDYRAGGETAERFVRGVGDALSRVGFFAIENHGIPPELVSDAYRCAAEFFSLPVENKAGYGSPVAGQRGYTGFGEEHAMGSDAPDLKEFFQIGRVDVADDHPVHAEYGPNLWPAEVPDFADVLGDYYRRVDGLGAILLEACGRYLGVEPSLLPDMAREGDTIVRVLYYPAIPEGAAATGVRAAAHEDINLITLLPGATAEGLELLDLDGQWLPIDAGHDHFIVDSGDMLQNLSNGLFRATTHRVVNPEDARSERFSMPCFVHPRHDVDLTPLPASLERTGGRPRYPSLKAGEYLRRRLAEIGLS